MFFTLQTPFCTSRCGILLVPLGPAKVKSLTGGNPALACVRWRGDAGQPGDCATQTSCQGQCSLICCVDIRPTPPGSCSQPQHEDSTNGQLSPGLPTGPAIPHPQPHCCLRCSYSLCLLWPRSLTLSPLTPAPFSSRPFWSCLLNREPV